MFRINQLDARSILLFISLVLVLVFSSACAGAGAPAATDTTSPPATDTPPPPPTNTPQPPTDTPEPTDTPIPTDTPTPTETATSTATPTPDLAATDAAIATQTSEAVLAVIQSELDRIGVSTEEGYLAWFQTEPESITVNTYDTLDYSVLDPGLKASDFVVHSEITWDSTGGWAICGIIMRSVEDIDQGAHYRFQTIRLSGWPSWDIERYEYGKWQATASGMIINSRSLDQENGATNRFTLIARDEKFTVFVNDDKPKNVLETALKEGIFAFMTWQDTGETTCTFSNTWVWSLD